MPVWVKDVHLIEISTSTRGKSLEWSVNIVEGVLDGSVPSSGIDVVGKDVVVEWEHGHFFEDGVDGGVGADSAWGTAGGEDVADKDVALVVGVAELLDDFGVVGVDVLEFEEAGRGVHGEAGALTLEDVHVAVVEVGVRVGLLGVREADGVEFGEERSEEGVNLSGGLAWGEDWLDTEGVGAGEAELVVDVELVEVGELVGFLVEDGDALPDFVGVLGVVEDEDVGGGDRVGEGLDGDGGNNTPGSGTSTTESPEEILVGVGVGLDKGTIGLDELKLEDLISSHTVKRRERTVSSTLDITSRETDTLTRH